MELLEYKARVYLSPLLRLGFIINENSSRLTVRRGGGGGSCEETPDEPGVASSGLRALGKGRILSSLLCHFPICQRKFVPDDLQGPAGSESVIFQERGPAQASGALGTSHQLLGEEGV